MSDVQEGDAHFALDALEFELHGLANLGVQGAHRLVQKQHLRSIDEGARESDALLLTTRELGRGPRTETAESEKIEVLFDQLTYLTLVSSLAT